MAFREASLISLHPTSEAQWVARVLLVAVAMVAAPVHAGQTCDTTAFPLSVPTDRFEDNGDGTLTDRAAGLMWMRCAVGQAWTDSTCQGTAAVLTWAAAQEAADEMNRGGGQFYNDWRLPTLRELALIIERQCVDPRTNLVLFPGTPAAFFWTSSFRQGEGFEDQAYALSFGPEGVEMRSRADPYHVRLVRLEP